MEHFLLQLKRDGPVIFGLLAEWSLLHLKQTWVGGGLGLLVYPTSQSFTPWGGGGGFQGPTWLNSAQDNFDYHQYGYWSKRNLIHTTCSYFYRSCIYIYICLAKKIYETFWVTLLQSSVSSPTNQNSDVPMLVGKKEQGCLFYKVGIEPGTSSTRGKCLTTRYHWAISDLFNILILKLTPAL